MHMRGIGIAGATAVTSTGSIQSAHVADWRGVLCGAELRCILLAKAHLIAEYGRLGIALVVWYQCSRLYHHLAGS